MRAAAPHPGCRKSRCSSEGPSSRGGPTCHENRNRSKSCVRPQCGQPAKWLTANAASTARRSCLAGRWSGKSMPMIAAHIEPRQRAGNREGRRPAPDRAGGAGSRRCRSQGSWRGSTSDKDFAAGKIEAGRGLRRATTSSHNPAGKRRTIVPSTNCWGAGAGPNAGDRTRPLILGGERASRRPRSAQRGAGLTMTSSGLPFGEPGRQVIDQRLVSVIQHRRRHRAGWPCEFGR